MNHVNHIDHTNRFNHTTYNNQVVLLIHKGGIKHMNDISHINHMNYMGRIKAPWSALGAWECSYSVQIICWVLTIHNILVSRSMFRNVTLGDFDLGRCSDVRSFTGEVT